MDLILIISIFGLVVYFNTQLYNRDVEIRNLQDEIDFIKNELGIEDEKF